MKFTNSKPIDKETAILEKLVLNTSLLLLITLKKSIAQAIEKGARVIWPIKKDSTVKKIAFVADPDGIPIELAER